MQLNMGRLVDCMRFFSVYELKHLEEKKLDLLREKIFGELLRWPLPNTHKHATRRRSVRRSVRLLDHVRTR